MLDQPEGGVVFWLQVMISMFYARLAYCAGSSIGTSKG